MLKFWLFFVFGTVLCDFVKDGNCTDEISAASETRVLSRRKRFLIFPEGSSLQLVFCVQTAALIPIGDIFLYGNTAGLAWTLPSDPMFFDYLKKHKQTHRRGDNLRQIGYLDENGRVIAKVPYKRRPIVNPAFAKRSVDDDGMTFKDRLKLKIDRMKMHRKHSEEYKREEELDEKSIEFHRTSRLELFGKIETLLSALGRDGRQCVLFKLCESAQNKRQGTFMQEFLKAVFTLPKDESSQTDEDTLEYDQAHTGSTDCAAKYPGCEDFDLPTQL